MFCRNIPSCVRKIELFGNPSNGKVSDDHIIESVF